jgi:aspartate carbamoyltransferase catalytic subunit
MSLISIDGLTINDIEEVIQQARQAERIIASGKTLSIMTGKENTYRVVLSLLELLSFIIYRF